MMVHLYNRLEKTERVNVNQTDHFRNSDVALLPHLFSLFVVIISFTIKRNEKQKLSK